MALPFVSEDIIKILENKKRDYTVIVWHKPIERKRNHKLKRWVKLCRGRNILCGFSAYYACMGTIVSPRRDIAQSRYSCVSLKQFHMQIFLSPESNYT